jgi:hypothetical protein
MAGGRIMAGQAPRKRHEVEAALIERATKDEAFRRALIADPTGTLEREIGAKAPEGFSLTVVEETPEHRYLVLPPAPRGEGGELSDAELESVAGGDGFLLPTYRQTLECI